MPPRPTTEQFSPPAYAYDVRGQKVAEWGTAVQPAAYEYDDAGRLTALTTWRVDGETISTDPRGMTGGDTTHWEYNDATGLELSITYADGRGTTKTYDESNRIFSSTDARNITTIYTYDEKTGLVTAIGFSTEDTAYQQYAYNILGQPTEISDASGTHTFTYDRYGESDLEQFSFLSIGYSLQEQWDEYGRNIGYQLIRNDVQLCAAVTGYAADGRIGSAGFIYGGQEKQFRYSYLSGSNLLATLTMPNNMQLTQSYEEKRDLLVTMAYTRGNTLVTQRQYTYDKLSRPIDRQTNYPQKGQGHADAFGYNDRSELTSATLDGAPYAYAYDNIGNRITAQEAADQITYATNDLNQYTQIDTDGSDFTPEYDADGNQTRVKTSTGIWSVTYNAQNRAIRYESEDGTTVITCGYDYMGRRFEKKVEVNGEITLHEGYIYHSYLQIACVDLQKPFQAAKRYITWDPTQSTATRPLALQQNSVWYTYGWDLTKNICELYNNTGYILNLYTYTPYGAVTANGEVDQPIQWSSEMHDAELGLVYYNYRYYNPVDGRWTRRDPIGIEGGVNLYVFVNNRPDNIDYLGNESCCAITLKLYLPEPLEIDKGDTLILRTGNSPGHTWLEFTNNDNKKQVFSFGPATTITISNYDRFLDGKMTSIPNYPIKKSASASRSWKLNHEQCEAAENAIRNKGYYPNKGNYTPTYQCTSAALDVLNSIPNLDNVPSGSGPVKFKIGFFTIWEDSVANPYHLSNELQKQQFSQLT